MLIVIAVLHFNTTTAQPAPHYAQYMYNMQVLNPAFVGSKSDLNATLLSRSQWVNVEGAPQTTTFSINTRLNSGFGIGATVISDQIGLLDNTNTNLDVSYTIPTSEFGRLALGVKAGLSFYNNDLASGISVDNEIYPSTSGQFGNFGFGMMFSNARYYVALSALDLLETPVFFTDDNIQTTSDLERGNYFFSGGMRFDLSKFNDVTFIPSVLFKYTPTLPLSLDINANFNFSEVFEAGVSYRHQNSVSAVASVVLFDKLRVGYAYENYFSNIAQNLSSHEIILRIDLKLDRNKRWLYLDCCNF